MLRRAQTIRGRLGVSANLLVPIWRKPKDMHWKTLNYMGVIQLSTTKG